MAQTLAQVTSSPLSIIRAAAQQKGVYKRLFSQGANGYGTAATLTQEFRTLLNLAGITLPEGVNIGLDSAQIILAGGAVVSDVAAGASILQCVGDVGIGLAGISQLLGDLGIIDHQAADFIGLISNGALVAASGGANVLADVGFVISLVATIGDLSKDFSGSADEARASAQNALSRLVKADLGPELAFASAQAQLFTSGKLDYFDFVANIALNSPVEFKSFFPNLAAYFPSWMTKTYTETATSSGWFSSQSDTERTQVTELVTTKQQVESVLLQKFFVEPMQSYTQFFNVTPTISLRAASALSLLASSTTKGAVSMGFNFPILPSMLYLGLTPASLGDDWLFKGFQKNEADLTRWQDTLPYPPLTLPYKNVPTQSGVTINGSVQYTAAELEAETEKQELISFQLYLQSLDAAGDIDALIQIPEALAILTRWADLRIDPLYDDAGEIKNMVCLNQPISRQAWYTDARSKNQNPSEVPGFWDFIQANYAIDLSDYWKCLNVLKSMEKSNLLHDDALNLESTYGTIDDVMGNFSRVYQFVLAKNLNRMARQNVANSLNIPVLKLASRRLSDGSQVFYQKAVSSTPKGMTA